MRSNPIRFTGMASGLDTDSIIKDLMRPQQFKIDREKKAQALVVLRQEAWKDMNKKLFDFHTKFAHKMSLNSTFNKSVTTSSNSNAISIDKNSNIPEGSHTFKVLQLAQSATKVGSIENNTGNELTNTTKISEIVDIPEGESITLTMKVNNKEVKVNVSASDTLKQLESKINTSFSKEGFKASYDFKNEKFFVSSTKTGENQNIVFSGSSEDSNDTKLLRGLGLLGKDSLSEVVNNGQDAEYEYNGAKFTSSTNKIEVNGIKATLQAANANEVINISSERDTDAIYTWVKEFVKEYNDLIEDLNEKLGTKPAKGIEPLTADERAAMSESDIKLWEDKINSSLFYKDKSIEDFVNGSRRVLGKSYGSDSGMKYTSLASLGIVTGGWEERGKLHINGDEDDALYSGRTNKLKEAIEADPDEVIKFLTTLGKDLYKEHNDKLKSSPLKSAMNFYNDKLMDEQVKDFNKKIDTLEERMFRMENMYYAKFAAMEKMLNSMNSQSSWLAQQLGGQ